MTSEEGRGELLDAASDRSACRAVDSARSIIRPLVLAAVLLFAGLALWFAPSGQPNPSTGAVDVGGGGASASARCGYRDPAGAISPDGRWIAYSEGRFLRACAARVVRSSIFRTARRRSGTSRGAPTAASILADGFQTQIGMGAVRPGRRHDAVRSGAIAIRCGGAKVSDLRQLGVVARRPLGRRRSSTAAMDQDLWTIAADGSSAHAQRMAHRIAFPAWTPRGRDRLRHDHRRPHRG